MKKVLCVFLSLIMILSLAPASVFAASTGASESYALSITNKPGTTFVLSQGEYTSDVCDLWKEIDSEGTGELKFDQSFSLNINDTVEVYNNFIDTKYPDGDREHYKALEGNNNGAIFYVQARVLINDYEYQFSSKASYMYAPYGLDGEYNEGCGEWNISSYYDDLSDFFTMSKDGGVLNLSLDGTVKEIYEALKAQDEALGNVTINNLEFELWVSCEVEYTGSWGSTNYTELSFDGLSHTLYDKHIYGSTSEYDNLSVVPVTAPLTVNVGPMYEDCYEPVQTEYSWYYEFVKEGYDSDEDETWYGYFEKDESKESDVLTETAPSGTIYGLAYGTVDSGENNSIMLSDILNEDNKAFINSFIGEKPRELGGKGQMSIVCAVTLTFEDGKQWVVYITKADYMSRLIIPCMHACTVCGLCTVTDEMLPCNFDQMSYDISNVCICEEPSVPEFSYETVHEEETTIESTDTTVKVVVEKIEVEETPTHSFIVNTTDAVGVDNVIGLYNINVFNEEGYPYTLNQYYDEGEELTVSVPVSMEEALALQSGEAALYHILADGTAEEVEGVTVVIDGESATMTFTSDSFSPYIVARTATTYTVTVTGGTASPAGPNAEGTEVTVTADPDPEGKKFKEWQIEGLSTTTSESRSIFFYMPANNVTITAIYEDANIIIESASATITEPVVGANPDFDIVSADESKYTVTVVKWNLLDGSSYPVLTADDKFERGESYQLDVKFVANPGYEFSDSCVYNVNGVSRAAYSLTKGERRCYFDVYEIIDTINVKGVVAPVAGATPDVSGITSDTDGINVIDVKWRDKDGYAFEGNPFVAGEKYILWLKYETESDYKVADDAEVTFNISDSNILDKEITHPIIKMTYEVPADTTYTVSFDANSGTGTMTPVTGISGEYELPACTFTAPSGKQFKAWSVGGSEKAVGDKITVTADTTVTAVWENVSTKTPIDTVNISDLAKPVVGEMPNNSITVNGTGVTVDDEGSYWGRFVSPSFSPVYDDDTAVDSVVFREGETYMFQLYLNAAAGYEFTADSKFYFASDLLPAPDMTDLSKSFAMVNPSDSTQAVIYINMNDIAHVHVPGDWYFNDTHHWRECTASGCDAGADVSRLPDYAEHSFVNGLCTCGAHKHNWSADWFVNETHHWHECSANGCSITDNSGKDGYAAHDFTAGACVCGVENVITSIEINGITSPVAGETPINSASVDKVGAEVDEENTFWVRYDVSTGRTSDTYADGTSVHDTPFRDREIYLLQITIKPKTGYSFTADTKLLYGGTELSAPDAANPTASCGAIAPDYSMAMALINADGTSAPLTYTVTFDANGGSVTPANATTEATGKLATLPTPTRSGSYTFKGWYTASSGGTKITTDTVFDADTTIYAQWNYTGSTGGGGGVSKYTVKFETNGGSTVASKSVTRNAKLAEPTAPTKDGFKFDGWYTDKELKTAYDFDTKVTKSFTLYAKWTEIEKEPENDNPVDTDKWVNPFTDVKENDWFFADVQYVAENNLMNGVAADKFAPNDTLTRAMLVTVLYRNEGEPAVNKSIPFADIDMSAYYANAVIWAQQNGIVNGVSETEFAPNDNITREQIAAIMHRYAQYKGYDVSVGENTNILSYDDFDSISEYAIAAMQYACGSGLMKGKTASTLNPKDNATRAEIAAILHRFIEANK